MKTKNLVTLAVAALVVVLLTVLCLTGVQVGKYIVIPAADGIARGNDFATTTFVVLNVNEPAQTAEETAETAEETAEEEAAEPVPASAELYADTLEIIRKRASMLTLSNIAIMEQGENRVRIEMPTENVTDASNILFTLTQPCHVYITNPAGDVVLEGEDIVSTAMNVDSTGSAYYVSIKVEEEALSAWADKTEDLNENVTVWLDEVQVCTVPVSQILSTGMGFSDSGSAITIAMALQTGRIHANLTTAASGSVPADMNEDQFDRAMLALALAVVIAAIVMIVVFRGAGFVSALSIVLSAVCVVFFFGCVPYIAFGAASFVALAAVLAVKMFCDLDLLGTIGKVMSEGEMTAKEAVSAAWRQSGLRVLEICGVSVIAALVVQYFGGTAVSAFTSVYAIGALIVLAVSVIFTRPLITCVMDKAAKESK